ncbi:class I SAM-dependent methyltransferase [Streptomyces seoulensis]|uniref:class I SAM-dependent methyltransferase n=1 Tax=Streptomyces seoulensis TaxID=73044 RepID=UPI00365AF3D6
MARKLAARVPRVTGVDLSPEMIARARGLSGGRPGPLFLQGDFLTAGLPAEGYDFICSVTAVHHMDFTRALLRMRQLLRPGGTLVVVGLAREQSVGEWAVFLTAAPVMRVTKAVRRAGTPEGMPVADAEMSYGEVRRAARELLPGVRYRRHVLRRYSLTWRKPLTRS